MDQAPLSPAEAARLADKRRHVRVLKAVVLVVGATLIFLAIYHLGYKPAKESRDRINLARMQVNMIGVSVLGLLIDRDDVPTPEQLGAMYRAQGTDWPILTPWGHPIIYIVDPKYADGYQVISLGSDNEPGGTGEAADYHFSDLAQSRD